MTTIAQRWRKPSLPVVFAATAALTALTYLLVWLLAPAGSYGYELFFERSWIQPASTLCFWLTVVTLAAHHLEYRYQRDAYERAREVLSGPEFTASLIWSDADLVRQRFSDPKHGAYHDSIAFSRIVHAMDRLRKTQSTRSLEDYFRTRSDGDAGELDTSYAGVRYFIWLIPTLGFLGTVMGIGMGIAQFAEIIRGAQGFQQVKDFLPEVTRMLGTAFDTTLLALVYSAVAFCYLSFLLKKQEQLLAATDTLCFDEVCAQFQEHSTASDQLVGAVQGMVKELREGMNGNRAQIEQILRQELPMLLAGELALRDTVKEIRDSMNGNRAELARVAREELPARMASELAPRLDGLLAALRELRLSQQQASDGLADLRELAEQVIDTLGDAAGRRTALERPGEGRSP